jgi:hypothetical protein
MAAWNRLANALALPIFVSDMSRMNAAKCRFSGVLAWRELCKSGMAF